MFIFRLELRRHRRYPEPSDVLRTDSVGRVSSSYLGPVYMVVGEPGILGNPPVHIMLPGTDRVTLSNFAMWTFQSGWIHVASKWRQMALAEALHY